MQIKTIDLDGNEKRKRKMKDDLRKKKVSIAGNSACWRRNPGDQRNQRRKPGLQG